MMKFGFDPFWPGWLAGALLAAAATAHLYAYSRTTKPIEAGVRRLLLTMRLAAVALIIIVLWRPAAESETTVSRKPRMALLVDVSRSMSIGDEDVGDAGTPVTRLARAQIAFAENRRLWKEIVDNYEISTYAFSRTLSALGVQPGEIPAKPLFGTAATGPVTAIGDALREATKSADAPEVILLVSDGLSNSGIDPLDAAQPGRAPVYTLAVGRTEATESTRDAAVTAVFAPPEAFLLSEVPVTANLSLAGLEGRTVNVHFSVDGKEAGSKEIAVAPGQTAAETRFSFTPDKEGPARVEVKIDPLADEIVVSNNSAATYVDVKSGKMKVIYVEGGFRWETKFIRMALESAKDVDFRLLVPRGPDDAQLAKALADEWDVLVVGNVPASGIPADANARIVEAVEKKGRGVLFLAGDNAFGKGGYDKSPLAGLIPFELDAKETVDTGSYVLEPKEVGPNASLVAVGSDASTEVWKTLPPLISVNLVGKPKPGAAVLLAGAPVVRDAASGTINADPRRAPASVFAVEEVGAGRSAAMAGEGTWQWVTGAGLTDAAARDAAKEAHTRFWRQVLFWLAHREERGDISLNLTLPRHRVDLGERIQMEARVLDSTLKPLTDATLTATIESQGGSVTKKFWLEGDRYKADFDPTAPGDYTVKVAAARTGAKVAEKSSAFVVAGADVEFATLVSRPQLLEALSRATGASYATASGAAAVFSDINRRATSTKFVKLDRKELWSSYWYVALIAVLLTIEWVVRKRNGLV
jgi:hypothetical protein